MGNSVVPYIFCFLTIFFEIQFFDFLNLIEVAFVVLTFFALKDKPRFFIGRDSIYFFLFIVWVMLSYQFINDNYYIIFNSFVNNTIRLIAVFGGFLVIPFYIFKRGYINNIVKSLSLILFLVAILSIFEFIGNRFFQGIDFSFNYLFFNLRNLKAVDRVKVFFSEPAHLAIFNALLLSVVFYAKQCGVRVKYFYLISILSVFTLLFSTSLIGYLFAVLFVMWMYIIIRKVNRNRNFNIFIFIVIFFLIAIILYNTTIIGTGLLERTENVFALDDGSSNHRLFGHFEITKKVLNENFLFGVGWGQQLKYIESLLNRTTFEYYWTDGKGSGINNMISSVLIQTGAVGLFFYIFFYIRVLKQSIFMIFVFIILLFSWGFVMSPLLWFVLIVFKGIKIQYGQIRKNEVIY